MKSYETRRVAAAGLLLLVACAKGGPTPLSEADKTAIRANDQKFTQAVLARDSVGVAAMYTDNASFMPPNQPAVTGRAAIQTWMGAFPPVSAFTLDPQEIDGSGDVAYVRGNYTISFTPPGATTAIEDHGKYIVVDRKQADGSWLIVGDIFNSDVPLPAPAPAPAARK